MNAKEFVQIVKKMFSKGLTPEEFRNQSLAA